MEDKRFNHISKDPKFRRIPKSQSKIKIDKRFHSMFTDKKFQVKYTVDKRGRPVQHHSNDDLKRYYDVSSNEDDSSDDEKSENIVKDKPVTYVRSPVKEESESETPETDSENQLDVVDNSDKNITENIKEKLRDLTVDYARGEQNLYSESSSDDEETDDEVSESEEIDHMWGELDADADKTEESSHRLAACNLDWDRIRAIDLMMLFNSFLPPGGVIHSVAIYPSEFGKQRMKEEEIVGPKELVDSKKDLSDDETEEGSKYHMEKLRQYQLYRLKYYYAVITFDNVNSANKVYSECDGMEYESSATKIDLRFIPDDMTFEDTPKDIVEQIPEKYEPRFFTTTALQQAKVNLTWDETNPDRLEFTEKINSGKLDDISDDEMQNFVAGSDNEEEDLDEESNGEEEPGNAKLGSVIDKYKALLQDIQEKENEAKNKKFEMEISWDMNVKNKTDKIIKEKIENSKEKTPFQKYIDKRKEKRKDKKELKKMSQEEKQLDVNDIPSDIDMDDPYFAEEFNNPEFKKPNKKKKKNTKINKNEEDEQKDAELALLLMNEENEKNHFSLKKIQDNENDSKNKKKRRKGKDTSSLKEEDTFEVNVEDQRFSALFTSHHFNIDPTDPHYKKTKGMVKLVEEKLKRRNEEEIDRKPKKVKAKGSEKKDAELSALVKNIKRKTIAYNK